MDGLLHPVGPEPASVYWRRRAVVVGLPVVLVVILVWLLSSGSSDQPQPAAAQAAGTSSESASPAVASSPSASASPTAAEPCKDADLAVSVEPSAPSYQIGGQAVFVMKVQNKSGAACTRDVGAKNNSFLVTSGGFRVWSSDDCSPGGASQLEVIPPAQAFGVQGTWNQTITSPGCPSPQDAAQPGSYEVEASNGGVTSARARFGLDG